MMKGMIEIEIKYLTKPASTFSSNFSGKYIKPATCPFCGYGTDATFAKKEIYSFNENYILAGSCKCTSCGKTFFFACEYEDNAVHNPILYPAVSFTPYKNETLATISERFIDMYNQALQCEFVGNIELAAIGYRSSLEILIKDFAITELKKSPEEVVSKKLCTAISEYLKQPELVNTADVIRILGNDYTHYKRKYPEHDFHLLKGYMDIFLKQIEVQYMINHPPVSRTP